MCNIKRSKINNLMRNLHLRLNLDLGKENIIYHDSSKEHLKISKIAKLIWLVNVIKQGKYTVPSQSFRIFLYL